MGTLSEAPALSELGLGLSSPTPQSDLPGSVDLSSSTSQESHMLSIAEAIQIFISSLEISERALTHARQATDHAIEVLRITTAAFEVGATTNLEVIDAQRSARDAATGAALAEDTVRRAKLDLLVAIGRFPK